MCYKYERPHLQNTDTGKKILFPCENEFFPGKKVCALNRAYSGKTKYIPKRPDTFRKNRAYSGKTGAMENHTFPVGNSFVYIILTE